MTIDASVRDEETPINARIGDLDNFLEGYRARLWGVLTSVKQSLGPAGFSGWVADPTHSVPYVFATGNRLAGLRLESYVSSKQTVEVTGLWKDGILRVHSVEDIYGARLI